MAAVSRGLVSRITQYLSIRSLTPSSSLPHSSFFLTRRFSSDAGLLESDIIGAPTPIIEAKPGEMSVNFRETILLFQVIPMLQEMAMELDYKPPEDFEVNNLQSLVDFYVTGSKELWLIQCPLSHFPEIEGKELKVRLDKIGVLGGFEDLSGKEVELVSFASQSVDEDGVAGDAVEEEINEEVVGILQRGLENPVERVDLSGRKLRLLPEACGRIQGLIVLDLSNNQLQILSRVVQLEEGKENGVSVRTGQYKAFRPKLLLILALFLALAITIFIISVSTVKYTGLQSVVTTVTSTFVPCREDDASNSLSRWIQPPPHVLMHNMTDEELLWRASFWPRRKGYPFKRVPKIAFMFLTKGPLPLSSLWERFLKGHEGLYAVYVHPDPSYAANFPADSVFYKRQIPSQVAEWGRMTMCDAEKRLLGNALLDISNEWFVLVSESCIPLYNFTTIYSYLSQSQHSFMGAVDVPGPFGQGRYDERMEPEVPFAKWRKGPQWFEVDRDLAATIVEDTLYHQKFREFCRPACYSDEHYFPTMLTIEKPMALANRSVTWTDWSRGGPHPATFGESDITETFFKKIFDGTNCAYNGRDTSMCYLFARKFAPSALEPLLLIAPKILGF